MKGAASFLLLVFLSIGFLIINSIVSLSLTIFLAGIFSGGVSFLGFPVWLVPAINITFYITLLIVLPILLLTCIKIYNKIVNKFNLEKFNKYLVLALSGIIISLPVTIYPITLIKSQIKQKINNSVFKVNASIVDEKVKKVRHVYPVKVEYINEYHYKILLDNKTNNTFKNMAFSVKMGFNNGDNLFKPDIRPHPRVTINPGLNYVSGTYKVEPSPYRRTRNPEKIFMHLSISNDKIYKTYELQSKLPIWAEIFQNN